MSIFVIGATGFVGGSLARHLVAAGHPVTGLARTDAAAAALAAQGITPVAADLGGRRPAVVRAALRADTVVYAAQPAPDQETATVQELTRALAGTGRTLVFLSGSGVLMQRTSGAWSPDVFAEHDPFTTEPPAAYRKAAEDAVIAAAGNGVRSLVVRPGLIWGPGDHGHVSMIYRSVAATGAASYVGPGLNTYSHVHIDDVVRLFTLALDHGRAGGLYHAVAGETPNRWIAEKVAEDLGVGARSLTDGEAVGVWGTFGALIMAASSRIRAVTAQRELGWRPEHTDMLSMIGEERLRRLARPGARPDA
ncbi:NAD-dependent epimerase/dehydratase family protein [Streptomyces sp. CAI-121]|uniref:NAD-dependent epimerase/dehydratase family protein n=1 Tax=unclassified Streptomyces TaxID=2593676 RepID=UPI0015878A04|nr:MULTISPECIES: NAD-dependent epimerase/dehydratase family protein [unclassified Streptomyces]NUV70010.1 NAD-dependent epimerase/dehydratase family protein [Streptomyces sp. CAI-121]NUW16218.1 NAD-dependent epimerase/dehydratase family protein [Streptomyces sp. CAI-68]